MKKIPVDEWSTVNIGTIEGSMIFESGDIEAATKDLAQSFSLSIKKVRHRLLIKKQIEIHPRLVPLVRRVFELVGFNVKLDAEIYHGVTAKECQIAMGIHHGKCDVIERGDDAEDTD